MDELVERISEFVSKGTITVDLRLPADRADLLARLHREGTIGELRYEGESTYLTATMPTRALEVYAPFLAAAEEEPAALAPQQS